VLLYPSNTIWYVDPSQVLTSSKSIDAETALQTFGFIPDSLYTCWNYYRSYFIVQLKCARRYLGDAKRDDHIFFIAVVLHQNIIIYFESVSVLLFGCLPDILIRRDTLIQYLLDDEACTTVFAHNNLCLGVNTQGSPTLCTSNRNNAHRCIIAR